MAHTRQTVVQTPAESPCPRGLIYKSLSSSTDVKVLENFRGVRQTFVLRCDAHTNGTNSVNATVREAAAFSPYCTSNKTNSSDNRPKQVLKTKTKTTGSKQRHFADLTCKYLLISTVVTFQAQNRETINRNLKSCYVLQDHNDDERYKIVFHKTTPELQDQDKDRCFWSQTGLVLRPTVSVAQTTSLTNRHLLSKIDIIRLLKDSVSVLSYCVVQLGLCNSLS